MGVDVRTLDLTELRRQIGMVAQDTLLFSATIAENIAFGRPDATQAEIERVAKLAQAHDFITNARRLQDPHRRAGRRSFRRAAPTHCHCPCHVARPQNPDPGRFDVGGGCRDRKAVASRHSQVMQGRTTILVAHRLSTAQHADRIIVLRDGEIVEQGTHDELAAAGGYYHHVLEMQQMSAEESVTFRAGR